MPRILVVDDFDDFPELIRTSLKEHKEYIVDSADSGENALKLLPQNCIDHQCYDLIIIDFAMPIMDGLTCAKRIRDLEKHLGWNDAGIIFFTAYSDMTRVSSSILRDLNAIVWDKYKIHELIDHIIKEFTVDNCKVQGV